MMRRLRLGVPLLAAVAAVVGAVLAIVQPWDSAEDLLVHEAAGQGQEYSFCNVSLQAPPSVRVFPRIAPSPPDGKLRQALVAVIDIPTEMRNAESPYELPSGIAIDAQTGEVLEESYRTPADRGILKGVLAARRIGPPDASIPAWPRTDTQPKASEKIKADKLEYLPPDPGAGMIISHISAQSTLLQIETCKSKVSIDEETGVIVNREVHPDEEQMFQRLLNEVTALGQ